MTTTRLNDLFDQMEREKGNELDDKIQLENDFETEEIFNIIDQNVLMFNKGRPRAARFNILENYFKNTYSSKTITKFTLKLTDEFLKKSIVNDIGFIINYLIQKSEDQDHTIITTHLKTEFYNIGYANTKNIKVIGNLGSYTGAKQKSGKVHITQNVESHTGYCMDGGEITIEGNATFSNGIYMKGGVLRINGAFGTISHTYKNGEIYHKDKLIAKDGKILDE